jgi:predicted transcriptional regulator
VPPSIHPSGAAYRWQDQAAPLAPLPRWLTPNGRPTQARLPAPARPDLADVARRASAYLAAMPPAIQGCAGHNALLAAATALVHGFDLPVDQARHLLVNEFNPRCQPPWDLTDRTDRRDFERKLSEALRLPHDRPRGYLLNDDIDYGPGSIEHGRQVAEALLAKLQQLPPEVGVFDYEMDNKDDPVPFPEWLLAPCGMVGTMCGWINSTAYVPQPSLALANTLAFFGTLYGRKVRSEWNLRTNLYCLGIAESCDGKEHSRSCVKSLCQTAGIADHLLGGEEIASDSALLLALHRKPACLFQLDEIGHMIAAQNSYTAANYQRAIPVALTKLFSSASTLYMGKEYASDDFPRKDIDQPNACVYGTTNPTTLLRGITTSQIRDGFLGRMLVFQSDRHLLDPAGNKPTPPPADLVAHVQAWFQRRITPPDGGNLEAFTAAHQITVPNDPRAERIFLDFEASAIQRRRILAPSGNGLDALWGRAAENARKVAMIVAASQSFDGIVIGCDTAAWACKLVEHLITELVKVIKHNVSDSEIGRQRLEILRVIRKAGGSATRSAIIRAVRITMRDLDDAMRNLIEGGYIHARTTLIARPQGGGRPVTIYQLATTAPPLP